MFVLCTYKITKNMKTKITLLKTVASMLLFAQAALSTAAPVNHSPLQAMPTFSLAIAAITEQPQSINVCEGDTAEFTVAVEANGTNPTYVWRRNGVTIFDTANVSGTNTPTLTIMNVTERDAAEYTCYIHDGEGFIVTQPAYLNAAIIAESGSTTCEDNATVISVSAIGNDVQYQWYYSATNSNTGGTLLEGETADAYFPSVEQEGTRYYYVIVYPAGYEACAAVTSSPIAVNVGATDAGTVSLNQIVCPNTAGAISISGSFGDIQWQESVDGINNWTDVIGGMGENNANYITPTLTQSMFYRAQVGNLTCGIAYSDVISVTVTQTYTWTGADGTDWNDAGNWACSIIPTLNENVLIPAEPGNQPVVASGIAYAKTLTIENGASLTVETGRTLRVQGSISVGGSANLTVANNASLIQDNEEINNGVINVIKNSNPLYRLDYTMWSSPVSGQELQDFSPATVASRFYEYKYDVDEAQQTTVEQYFQIDPSADFEAAKGYLIRMPNIHSTPGYNAGTQSMVFEGTFTGAPHNGTQTIPASVNGNRYTAVGNPYPSPISVTQFFDQNNLVLEEGSAIYLWRKRNDSTATSYATLTRAGLVANDAEGGGDEQVGFYTGDDQTWILSHGQGFIVKTAENPATPNIVFSNSMRRPAATEQGFFRTGPSSISRLWLNLTGNRGFSQTAVAYIDGATTNIDYGYDGKRLNEGENISLYTLSQNNTLAIQARPAFTNLDVVQLGFVAPTAGEYTVALERTEGVFSNGQEILIKDNLLGTTTPLTSSYTFTTEAGTFNDRFEVVYTTAEALNNNNPAFNANSVIVFKDGAAINVNSGNAIMNNVTIYDMGGRRLYTKNNVSATQIAIPALQVQQQVIIVEVDTDLGRISKKIVY